MQPLLRPKPLHHNRHFPGHAGEHAAALPLVGGVLASPPALEPLLAKDALGLGVAHDETQLEPLLLELRSEGLGLGFVF